MRGRRVLGAVDTFVVGLTGASMLTVAAGQSTLRYIELKTDPADDRELYALAACFVAGCLTQLFFLMSRVGIDKKHPWPRWIGEIALGGITAYAASVGYLRYGPDVVLTTLIVVAALAGFVGQRLLISLAEFFLKKAGINAKLSGGDPPSGT